VPEALGLEAAWAPLEGVGERLVSAAAEAAAVRWRPMLDGELESSARAVALDVAERLRDRDRLEAAIAATMTQTEFPEYPHWEPYSVPQGDAGLAVLAGYVDACVPGRGWDATAHQLLAIAARGSEQAPYLLPGLHGGLAGLAFAASTLSRGGTRYRRLLASLDRVLLPQAIALSRNVGRDERDISVSEFDVISGVSGIGAYLLTRADDPAAAGALRVVLEGLVAMTADDGGGVPRWYTPAHLMGDETMAELYPDGNLNCGLAHGIPGPLALMALALQHGFDVAGLRDAVDRLAGWLIDQRISDAWGTNWPTAVALPGQDLPAHPALGPDGTRCAWCYGGPGVARAVWLAGDALDSSELRGAAVETMEAVYRRPVVERRIDSPTFCHGVSGLLQITLRFANDTGLPVFTDAARSLTEQLLGLHEPDRILGFCSIEPGGNHVDQPGLLDGAPGVALVLFAATSAADPAWDRMFLLA